MDNVLIEGNNFITEDMKTAAVVFTTAENDYNVYFKELHGKENLGKIKQWFNLQDIGYLRQCHSDIVQIYDGSLKDGDAIVTNKPGIGIGVFTADCVPVLIYDEKNKAAAAVHSGWRGTYSGIVSKTIEKMQNLYASRPEDLLIFIGPHMRDCCYEVGQEVIEKFTENPCYSSEEIFKGKNLSMEKCILKQLKDLKVPDNNIKSLKLCTYCSTEPKLYSYRKGHRDKRLFSFIFIK